MKARQKGKQNKKFEFIVQTQKEVREMLKKVTKRFSVQKDLPFDLQHILNDNLSSLYED